MFNTQKVRYWLGFASYITLAVSAIELFLTGVETIQSKQPKKDESTS